jgi:L-rhamnose isomerase
LFAAGTAATAEAVWDMFCLKNNVPVGEEYIADIEKYEANVTSKRC